MRTRRWLPLLLILPATLLGCSSMRGLGQAPSDVKTLASVGDRPLPVRSGDPESSVRSGVPEPIVATSTGRISGRVYDEQGKPVADARVRLAVGSEPGGKAVVATTDRSGAFTLRGLRAGSSYTVIAEYQGRNGPMTGRAEAEAPDANVRIGLQRKTTPRDEARTTIRPARPNVAPASSVDESDDDAADEAGPRFNREDIDPPAPEAERVGRAASDDEPRPATSRTSARWSQAGRPAAGDGQAAPSRREKTTPKVQPADEDDENPLPPAIESDRVGDASASDQDPDASVKLARGPSGGSRPGRRSGRVAASSMDEETGPGDDPSPRPLEGGVIAGARSISPEAYGPIQMSDPETPNGAATEAPTSRPAAKAPTPALRRSTPPAAPERARPTWGELSFMTPSVPLDESLLKASRSATSGSKPVAAPTASPVGSAPSTVAASAPSLLKVAASGPACRFDAAERRLDDFILPDVQGRMTSFRELDADLVLLDFWGTWCAPCRKSVGHLVEIQQKLGGKRIQVVGIACEKSAPKDRAARVGQTVKQLGINYPVLISTMDGTCPVQDAFQIQFYPTLVLVDREGRILWREQGATDVTLARMDRFIARNLKIGGPRDPGPSPTEMARAKD